MFATAMLVAALTAAPKPKATPKPIPAVSSAQAYKPRTCTGLLQVTGLAGKTIPVDQVRHAVTQLFEAALMTHGDTTKSPTLEDIAESFADVWHGCLQVSTHK